MRERVIVWGLLGSAVLSAAACSGRNLNDVGQLNTTGGAGQGSTGGQLGNGGEALGGAGSSPVGSGGGGTPNGGAGASAGMAGADAGAAGEGGGHEPPLPPNGALVCKTCQTVSLAKDIRGAAANDQKVFWIEYGTNDKRGNYNNDGRLFARDLAGGTTSVLASSLAGPEAVALSGKYVYLAVDQGIGPDHFRVDRVPLSGGAAEVVQTPPSTTGWSTYEVFAFAAGSEYWNWGGAVYRLDDASTSAPETFVAASNVYSISLNSSTLYYSDAATAGSAATTWSKPLAGGDPVQVSTVALAQADDNFLYSQDGSYLTLMPISGGTWKRVGRGFNYHLAIAGDAYFTDLPNYYGNQGALRIMQESFSSFDVNVALATEAIVDGSYWKAFAYSRVGIFFADAGGLYLVPPAKL